MRSRRFYRQLRRDTKWAEGASRGLEEIRAGRLQDDSFGRWLQLGGWRPRGLLSDVHLLSEVVNIRQYGPPPPPVLPPEESPPEFTLIPAGELEAALRLAMPISDVLAFLIREWPEVPLRQLLKAYADVVSGHFGLVEVANDALESEYELVDASLFAVPVALREVSSDARGP